jgi:DNA mismatch repair protein MutL
VVKELIENSLDAGATRIDIRVEGAGRKLIEVSDDGSGIPGAEIEMAISRHATSKLRTVEDLFDINTLGFRGEALASIAAVSRLELTSRAQDEEVGTRLRVQPGKAERPERVGIPPGTRVLVQDLFHNVPARLKFLKSEETERRRIAELVARYAVANPSVRMTLQIEGREALRTTGAGDQREALASVYGLAAAREMVAVLVTTDSAIRVRGHVSPPSVHRSNRKDITFFVNGRLIHDASLASAVVQAYQGLLMVGRYPLAFLELQVPPQDIDVNVHPAKAEVRFKEADRVFSILQRAVRATLLGQAPPPEFHLPSPWAATSWPDSSRAISPDWQIAHSVSLDEGAARLPAQAGLPEGKVPLLRAVGQVGATYLVAEGPDGLYLIDQHSAHERILFEDLMAGRRDGSLQSQRLLEAVTVDLPPSRSALLHEQLQSMQGFGFEIEPFGAHSFRVTSVPALLAGIDPAQAVHSVVEDFEEDETPLAQETEAKLAARVCKRAAVKAGQVLSLAEQERLVRDLERCRSPRTCPHGRPTMIHLSVAALERQFGRRG